MTNLYLTRDDSDYVPPSFVGGWDSTNPSTSGPNKIRLHPQKYGDIGTSLLTSTFTSTAPGWKAEHIRGISNRIAPQTITGTVDLVIGVDVTTTSDLCYWRLHIYVINETTGAVLGTLLNGYQESAAGGATVFPTVNTGKALKAPQTLTSVVVPSDANHYRIVAEIGSISDPIRTTLARMRRGVRDSSWSGMPDLVAGSTTPIDESPFLQFSATLLFEAPVAPTNLDPETALDWGVTPLALSFDPGMGYPRYLWFKFHAPSDIVLSLLLCNASQTAEFTLYNPGAPPITVNPSGTGFESRPQTFPAKAGDAFLVRFDDFGYIAGQVTSVKIEHGPQNPIQKGDLAISDDLSDGLANLYDPSYIGYYPYVWYSPTGEVRHVTAKLPATELFSCLAIGVWAIINFSNPNDNIYLYNMPSGLTEIGRFTPPDGNIFSMGTDFNFFYLITTLVYDSVTPRRVFKVSSTGVITGPIATGLQPTFAGAPGAGGSSCCGVARDGSIIYYPYANTGVQRHNLLTNTPLAAFPSPDPVILPLAGDVIVLSDGTIAAIFYNNATPRYNKLIHYAADGTILHVKDFGPAPIYIHHIVHEANDHPNKVWVWTEDISTDFGTEVGKNYIQLIELSTGNILQSFTKNIFEHGEGGLDPTLGCGPVEMFGSPSSCPLMVAMKVDTPEGITGSGIYKIEPNTHKRNDTFYNADGSTTDTKIPDPFGTIGNVGD